MYDYFKDLKGGSCEEALRHGKGCPSMGVGGCCPARGEDRKIELLWQPQMIMKPKMEKVLVSWPPIASPSGGILPWGLCQAS